MHAPREFCKLREAATHTLAFQIQRFYQEQLCEMAVRPNLRDVAGNQIANLLAMRLQEPEAVTLPLLSCDPELARLDEWRQFQPDQPSRAAAARLLALRALRL